MKAIRPLVIFAVSLMLLSSCTKKVYHIHTHKRTPPGHAKKMHGDKSAKKYAPGQRKKKH